ncbi:MAG: 5-methylcytosine-specific restriction endonuclease system specificity protein McrC [Spirochaetales bacterium]|nr:5-methylcytosine-specific restriction endonuclease system specificity protein McrC [Spirochaetales bacterium]
MTSTIEQESTTDSSIPIRNIWLLIAYASEFLQLFGENSIGVEDNPDQLPDLIAEILCFQVEKRIGRNMSHGLERHTSILGRVRGKILLLDTIGRGLLERGRIRCQFDRLTIDTRRYQFILASLAGVAKIVDRPDLASHCLFLSRLLERNGVSRFMFSKPPAGIFNFGRHDIQDKPMVMAAKLAHDLLIPNEIGTLARFISTDKNQHYLRKLFEKGIAGFYNVLLSSRGWVVEAGKGLDWSITRRTNGIDAILPSMRSDIYMTHRPSGKRIIIDTKFNSLLTKGWYRDMTLRNSYIYQIYTYLRSQENLSDAGSMSSLGILLHPAIGENYLESVTIQSHEIRFATVDLSTNARAMRQQLLTIIGLNE